MNALLVSAILLLEDASARDIAIRVIGDEFARRLHAKRSFAHWASRQRDGLQPPELKKLAREGIDRLRSHLVTEEDPSTLREIIQAIDGDPIDTIGSSTRIRTRARPHMPCSSASSIDAVHGGRIFASFGRA